MDSGVAIDRASSLVVIPAHAGIQAPPALEPGRRRDDVSYGPPVCLQVHCRAVNMQNTL